MRDEGIWAATQQEHVELELAHQECVSERRAAGETTGDATRLCLEEFEQPDGHEPKWGPRPTHVQKFGDFWYQYTVIIYTAMMMIVGDNVSPQTSSENLYTTFMVILGTAVMALWRR